MRMYSGLHVHVLRSACACTQVCMCMYSGLHVHVLRSACAYSEQYKINITPGLYSVAILPLVRKDFFHMNATDWSLGYLQ
jgi:hypothetical protein